MLAEILLTLAGHKSSIFDPDGHTVVPAFAVLLHPGEKQVLESLGLIAERYRRVRACTRKLGTISSRYVAATCATLNTILDDEYDSLVIDLEARILQRDTSLVASGAFVPLSSVKAIFAHWSAPLAALVNLCNELDRQPNNPLWHAGPLTDLLLDRAHTGVQRISSIFSRLAHTVQRVWKAQLSCFLIHGMAEDFAEASTHVPYDTSIPSCVSQDTRDSIAYVGRAIAIVKQRTAQWRKRLELPKHLTVEHTFLLDSVMPEQADEFHTVIITIRVNVSEWMWKNVLTKEDVEETMNSLAHYFMLQDGEFAVSFIREIERLKMNRLTRAPTPELSMIREQDLHLAMLRASLGTRAQHDPCLTRLRVSLPSGPLRPLFPSLSVPVVPTLRGLTLTRSTSFSKAYAPTTLFDDLLLGTPLHLTYQTQFPLDLFLEPSELRLYSHIFSFLSSLRRTHMRVFECWSSLSGAQRARRRWTGLGEGGQGSERRGETLRAGWGVVHTMNWFLQALLDYVLADVVDVEFGHLKELLWPAPASLPKPHHTYSKGSMPSSLSSRVLHERSAPTTSAAQAQPVAAPPQLDFSTLRGLHTAYLERVIAGCLLSHPVLSALMRSVFEVCERFVGQVERWGGDVLPPLLFEGSSASGAQSLGELVRERSAVVREFNDTLMELLTSFYEHLSATTSQPIGAGMTADASALLNASALAGASIQNMLRANGEGKSMDDKAGDMMRRLERLLLKLDFNGSFSAPTSTGKTDGILREGGLA